MNLLFTYINTKLFLKALSSPRLNPEEAWIYVHKSQIEKRFKVDRNQIQQWSNEGLFMFKEESFNYLFLPLRTGTIDLSLVHKKSNLAKHHEAIRDNLLRCELPEAFELPKKLMVFFSQRKRYLDLFFKVDSFSGRIHTPISRMAKAIRKLLLIDDEPTCSIDVVTMQPLVLGKLLNQLIGANDFSKWINEGEDIYSVLQNKAQLKSRDEGKELFFQMSFGKSDKELTKHFGQTNWINTINAIKTKRIPENPHNVKKLHSNLSWLLQKHEVNTMTKIWLKLLSFNIPFLTVHDEIICKKSDLKKVESVFHSVLSKEFVFYKIKSSIDEEKQEELWWFFLDEPLPDTPIQLDENTIIQDCTRYVNDRVNSMDKGNNYNELNRLAQYLTCTHSVNI